MKKIFLLLAVSLISGMLLQAQGIYQLWGMTTNGGADDLGVIFNTDAMGNNFKLKYEFRNFINQGYNPAQLTEYNGKFYGMTNWGGSNNAGVIFEWDPATNIYSKKIDFKNAGGGIVMPMGNLTLSNDKFYGTTYWGGDGSGVIFEWDPNSNLYTEKIDFSYSEDGLGPVGSLVKFGNKFYGMTAGGGSNYSGVIFEWDPTTNIYTKKYDFNEVGGAYPFSGLILRGCKFYGVTSWGGINEAGVIFEWDPSTNEYIKKIDFDGVNGNRPSGSLTFREGKFYGMTAYGGNSAAGVIFEWNPVTNVYAKKLDLSTSIGSNPSGSFIEYEQKLIGMTSNGGSNDLGVIFEWDPATNVYTKKMDFDGNNGKYPNSSLTFYNGNFYGTVNGGSSDAGVIFEWNPITNIYSKKLEFNSAAGPINGSYPNGKLIKQSGKFYGVTSHGGDEEGGVIFEWNPDVNVYSKKFNFSGTNGGIPIGGLTLSDTKIYGTTNSGGSNDGGVIFQWNPITNEYIKKFDFGGTNGRYPWCNLILYKNKIYGTTWFGGSNTDDAGVIFEWDPVTNIYTKKIDLDVTKGIHPLGKLTESKGKVYGMTSGGGVDSKGVIFEWNPATNIYIKKFEFNSNNGSSPRGSLAVLNGKFYGMTYDGGTQNAGVIFEWDPITNVYGKKHDFDGINGSAPTGGLTLNNGKFYGTTTGGGLSGAGVIFEWNPTTNAYTKKKDFNRTDGASPGSDLALTPAPVSNGLPGSCKTFSSITINNSNNNQWVSITDEENNAVAEIKANGNNLGVVTTSMFINNAAVREDGTKKLYLDRNITITPEVQPTTPVDIRLYIKGAEFEALKNALNSNGQSSGIDSINDVRIYKVEGGCSPAVSTLTNPVVTIAGTWEADYVFSANITSFSSFYFAGKAVCTAPVITQVLANPATLWPPNHQLKNVTVNYKAVADCTPVSSWLTVSSNEPVSVSAADKSPDWIITDDHQVQLRAERNGTGSGRVYTITIHAADAAGNTSIQKTTVMAPHNANGATAKGSMDANGDDVDHELTCRVISNPTNDYFNLQIESGSNATIQLSLLDISGRLITKWSTVKDKTIRFGEQLKPGIYMINVKQGEQQKSIKIIKQ